MRCVEQAAKRRIVGENRPWIAQLAQSRMLAAKFARSPWKKWAAARGPENGRKGARDERVGLGEVWYDVEGVAVELPWGKNRLNNC